MQVIFSFIKLVLVAIFPTDLIGTENYWPFCCTHTLYFKVLDVVHLRNMYCMYCFILNYA